MPVGADAAAAMVIVEFPWPGAAIEAGLKLTVTPLGWPVADNATAESNPEAMTLVIVEVTLKPSTTETEVGEAERVNFGGGVTIKLKGALFVMPLPDPLTVMVYVPGVIDTGTLKVSVELPEPGAGMVMGLKVAVTPLGRPVADNVIAPSNPPERTGAIVVVPEPPCCTETELGEI